MIPENHKIAVKAASMGWPVAPACWVQNGLCSCGRKNCTSPGKHPLTKNGIKDAISEADNVRGLWQKYPSANVMVATGSISGICVIDVDVGPWKDGEQALRELEAQNEELPDTLRVKTGGGGFHYYFLIPEGVIIKNSASKLGPGIDIRGEGGYVLGPGSTHISGKKYQCEEHWDFDLDELAVLPIWVVDILGADQVPPAAATGNADSSLELECDCWEHRKLIDFTRRISEALPGCQEVTLNNLSFELGLILRNQHLDRDVVEQSLIAAGAKMKNQPGKPAWSLRAITQKVQKAVYDGLCDYSPVTRTEPEGGPDTLSEQMLPIGSETDLASHISRHLSSKGDMWVFDEGNFWRFSNTHWALVPISEVNMMIRKYDGIRIRGKGIFKVNQTQVNGVVKALQDLLCVPNFFVDQSPGINCLSGLISFNEDLTVHVLCHDPAHKQRHVIECDWSVAELENPNGPLFEMLLDGCFSGDVDKAEKILLVEEILGAVALGNLKLLPEQKAFILFGGTAANGKSQFLEIARGLNSEDATATIPLGSFSKTEWLFKLAGKKANIVDELSSAQVVVSDVFKSVVTGEPTGAKDLYRSPTTIVPTAIHILATNDLPAFTGGIDRGVERRLEVIEFNNTIPERDRIPNLGNLIAKQERPALLSCAVRGLLRLMKLGGYSIPSSSQKTREDWFYGSDPVRAWLRSSVKPAPNSELYSADVHSQFSLWCRKEGYTGNLPAAPKLIQRIRAMLGREVESVKVEGKRAMRGISISPWLPDNY